LPSWAIVKSGRKLTLLLALFRTDRLRSVHTDDKMTEEDHLLISGLKNGDRTVFEQIFRTYYPEICGFSLRYLPDPLVAEEVVQDLFCKVWFRRNEIVINTSLKSYLYKAAVNHALNYLRHQEMQRKYFDYVGFEVNEVAGGIHYESDGELQGLVQKALLELPEKRREIFEMSRFEGMKYHEIAEKLGINIKTVETQMTRALDFMRQYLKEYISIILLIISIVI
jgi:RNA polymerase sigma-70 factor (ECF subfamily)